MSAAAPALLAPLTLGLYDRQKANNQLDAEKQQADKAASDLMARKKLDEKRRSDLGAMAQRSLLSGFNRSSNYGGTLLTSGGTGGQSTILGA